MRTAVILIVAVSVLIGVKLAKNETVRALIHPPPEGRTFGGTR